MGEGNRSRERGREGGSGAVFPCRAAACQAEGQQRAAANQLLIENEPSYDAWAQSPAWGCWSRLPPTALVSKYTRVYSPQGKPCAGNHSPSCSPSEGGKQGEKHPAVLLPPSESRRWRKDPVWIRRLETHGETTISSKLRICWSSEAALTSRGCALLDPYVIPCNRSQDPTVGFVGPRQEKAPEPKRFPGSYNQAVSPFLPQVFLPFIPTTLLTGSSGGSGPKSPRLHPNPPSTLQNIPCLWRKATPDVPSAPTIFLHPSLARQLFPPFPYWFQFPSLTGPQLLQVNGCDPTLLRSNSVAWKCFGFGRGARSRNSLEHRNSRSCRASTPSPPAPGGAGAWRGWRSQHSSCQPCPGGFCCILGLSGVDTRTLFPGKASWFERCLPRQAGTSPRTGKKYDPLRSELL